MKSLDYSSINCEGMTNKPIITCAGDWNLFCTLEAPLVAAIPQDTCEWRRSYGRVTKSVSLDSSFVKFNKEGLQADNNWNLLKKPIFHIYWTDCADVEYYKTTLREEVEAWMKQLEAKAITDFMVVHVETYDVRKTNKLLPRTTVLDKIKGDFAAKQTEERFISVINPIKSEARSAESWRGLVAKLRHFVLVAYNKSLIKFEEYMREQREKRNDPEWDFCKYFILQEQLAFVLEMLSLYEEALVQYDELDALFSQFVLNSNITKSPKWLDSFKQPITSWQAPRLTTLVPHQLRDQIIKKKATLLEFRSYLFQRQCAMLLLTCKPWEISSRCLATVHNTMKELSLLNVSVAEGAASCWSLLACTETLEACENLTITDSSAMELCTAHQAPLLHYAKDKLHELGKLCGLLPGSPDPSSAQLHLVVMLSAGMGDSNGAHPTDRLKEALCSTASFQLYYLELAERAMATYKHIGRLRFARLIGRDLASFYSEQGETSKALVFLMDALRSYEEQGWKQLAAQTRLELVNIARSNDVQRFTKLSATIASTAELEILVRQFYFDEMMKSIQKNLRDQPESVLTELSDCFKLISVTLLPSERGAYITDNTIECRLVLESFLPKDVVCTKAAISVETCKEKSVEKKTPVKGAKTDLTVSSSVSQTSSPRKHVQETATDNDAQEFITSIKLDDLKPKNPLLNPLKIVSQLHYKEDNTLEKATIECINPKMTLKRSDSSKYRKPSNTLRADYTTALVCENACLKPGVNEITLYLTPKVPGLFKLGQVSLLIEEKLEFLSNGLANAKLGYNVVTQGVNVYLNKVDPKKDLIAGLEHEMELVVTSGSSCIEEKTEIILKASPGVTLHHGGDSGARLALPVPACTRFHCTRLPLRLAAHVVLHGTVWIKCPWWETATEVPLQFSPPMVASHRLLTCQTRKFVLTTLKCGARDVRFELSNAELSDADVRPCGPGDLIVGSDGTTASYMWELLHDPLEATSKPGPLKVTFSVQYRLEHSTGPHQLFTYPFEIQDYTTLFVIRTKLEPCKGSDFCRASQMCCLQLTVQRINETEYTSLMYEVLADQAMWAVLGRTAGVITLSPSALGGESVSLDVMPLAAGHLPLPPVRLSKYIAANTKDPKKDISQHPRLEPFSPGQVYHAGKAKQVHVLPPLPKEHLDV
ncbi:unnamed protein product [Plutella xylostella]|uniref:(diamondback moth) hypothetical protein n=1 Tax=Plutella xylostella TaxID=51655 RepID=A0A8S4EBP7_PLUXY|nr:unnamed protein product [Plutella xylostella]